MMNKGIKRYEMVNRGKHIGWFIEDYTGLKVKLKIEFKEGVTVLDVPLTLRYFFNLNSKEMFNDDVWFWVKNRVTPPTQDGIEDKLKAMGMSEYSPLAILHFIEGKSTRDKMYIKFE